MKSMKMMFAAALVFSVGLGFTATASAVRQSTEECLEECLGHDYTPALCVRIC